MKINRIARTMCAALLLTWAPFVLAHPEEGTTTEKKSAGAPAVQAHQHKHGMDAPSWLDEWGRTIQVTAGIVLVAGIVILVVLRRKRTQPAKDGQPPTPNHS